MIFYLFLCRIHVKRRITRLFEERRRQRKSDLWQSHIHLRAGMEFFSNIFIYDEFDNLVKLCQFSSNQVDSYSFHRGYAQNNSNQMKQAIFSIYYYPYIYMYNISIVMKIKKITREKIISTKVKLKHLTWIKAEEICRVKHSTRRL